MDINKISLIIPVRNCNNLEKVLLKLDQLFKKDRLISDEKKRTEQALSRVNDVRNKLESEVGSLNNHKLNYS